MRVDSHFHLVSFLISGILVLYLSKKLSTQVGRLIGVVQDVFWNVPLCFTRGVKTAVLKQGEVDNPARNEGCYYIGSRLLLFM